MTDKEKLLIIGAIDDMLIHILDHETTFTEQEKEYLTKQITDVYDTSSPKEIREDMIILARKLYDEIR